MPVLSAIIATTQLETAGDIHTKPPVVTLYAEINVEVLEEQPLSVVCDENTSVGLLASGSP